MYSDRDTLQAEWVSPFGHLRIKVCLPTPRSLSQATTSFIASYRLGIHRMRLFAWPYNPKQSGVIMFEQDSSFAGFSSTNATYMNEADCSASILSANNFPNF